MQVVILAAGKGERLWPMTRNTPKCLLEVGDGRTLLETQLLAIDKCGGVSEVIIVTGYRASQIEAKVRTLAEIKTPTRMIHNPFYDVSNNLASLWLALPYVRDDFIVVNGDDLFHPRVLGGLLAPEFSAGVTMTMDRKEVYDDDDMKIIDADNLLIRVGKDVALDSTTGESIGMIRFAGKGVERLRTAADAVLRREGGLNVFWLHAIQHIVDEGWPVGLYEVSEHDWREMDFHPDRAEIARHLEQHSDLEKWWT